MKTIPWSLLMELIGYALLAATISLLMPGCAHTSLYKDGKRIAVFQGNMSGMTFTSHADGSCSLSGDIDHATATKASVGRIEALGGVLTAAGITTLVR